MQSSREEWSGASSVRGEAGGRKAEWSLMEEPGAPGLLKSKEEIVKNWLPRYTDTPLDGFGEYVLLTNFINYVEMFAGQFDVPIRGKDKPM